MGSEDFERGVLAGKVQALEEMAEKHTARMDHHSDRLRRLERIIWIGIGGLMVLQALPAIKQLFAVIGSR